VGMEAHGMTVDNVIDTVKTTTKMGTDRPHVFREAAMACRKAGTLSVPGVYGGFGDAIPLGAIMQKGLTLRTGQTHVQRYSQKLLDLILQDRIDTTFLISHRLMLEDGPDGYKGFKEKQDDFTKVVLKPH
jgi:threonine dehydrogenase-like Zn-dependent dehydrogenase